MASTFVLKHLSVIMVVMYYYINLEIMFASFLFGTFSVNNSWVQPGSLYGVVFLKTVGAQVTYLSLSHVRPGILGSFTTRQ